VISKGREWPMVRLIDDFLKSKSDDKKGRADPAEVRLFYVALRLGQYASTGRPVRLPDCPSSALKKENL
jgi:hypothetical protein